MTRERRRVTSERLAVLQDRLRALKSKPVKPHERPIVEVGIQALRDRVAELGRQLRRAE